MTRAGAGAGRLGSPRRDPAKRAGAGLANDAPPALADALRRRERPALARAVTLVESAREADAPAARALLARVLPDTGGSFRVGVSGPPGVGKSTLIEALGQAIIDAGQRIAVLAVDPSSPLSGGSVLGDKTRMAKLAGHDSAFVRPSPAGSAKGGVAAATREAMLLCEAAGFDWVIVETVGVGQAEHEVAGMVDCFVVLSAPNAGDELQGIKRGILELAHAVVVNKADGASLDAAERAKTQHELAFSLFSLPPDAWRPRVLCCSATSGDGIPALRDALLAYRVHALASGAWDAARRRQNLAWMRAALRRMLERALWDNPVLKERLPALERRVETSELTVADALDEVRRSLRESSPAGDWFAGDWAVRPQDE